MTTELDTLTETAVALREFALANEIGVDNTMYGAGELMARADKDGPDIVLNDEAGQEIMRFDLRAVLALALSRVLRDAIGGEIAGVVTGEYLFSFTDPKHRTHIIATAEPARAAMLARTALREQGHTKISVPLPFVHKTSGIVATIGDAPHRFVFLQTQPDAPIPF